MERRSRLSPTCPSAAARLHHGLEPGGCLKLYGPHTLPRERNSPAHLLQRLRLVAAQTIAPADDLALPGVQRFERGLQRCAELSALKMREGFVARGTRHIRIYPTFALARRAIGGRCTGGNAEEVPDLCIGLPKMFGELAHGRLTAKPLDAVPRRSAKLGDTLVYVNGDADKTRLIRDGSLDRLANLPCGVGGKAAAVKRIEFLNGADQAKIPLLNEIIERQATAQIPSRKHHHQAQVGLDHARPRRPVPGLNPLTKLGFLLGAEQRPLAETGKIAVAGFRGLR